MATLSTNQTLGEHAPLLTSPQLFWLALQATMPAGLILWQVASDAAPLKLFWNDPLGIKLAVGAGTLLVLNFAALLGGWFALNRLARAFLAQQTVLRNVLQGCLCAGCFVLFYLPAVFVLLIGPAVLTINSTLAHP